MSLPLVEEGEHQPRVLCKHSRMLAKQVGDLSLWQSSSRREGTTQQEKVWEKPKKKLVVGLELVDGMSFVRLEVMLAPRDLAAAPKILAPTSTAAS